MRVLAEDFGRTIGSAQGAAAAPFQARLGTSGITESTNGRKAGFGTSELLRIGHKLIISFDNPCFYEKSVPRGLSPES